MSLKCRTPEEAAGIEVKGEAHNNSKRKSQILRLTQHCYMDSAQFVNASWKWLVDSAGSIFCLLIGFLQSSLLITLGKARKLTKEESEFTRLCMMNCQISGHS
jgi:hypothetical protein